MQLSPDQKEHLQPCDNLAMIYRNLSAKVKPRLHEAHTLYFNDGPYYVEEFTDGDKGVKTWNEILPENVIRTCSFTLLKEGTCQFTISAEQISARRYLPLFAMDFSFDQLTGFQQIMRMYGHNTFLLYGNSFSSDRKLNWFRTGQSDPESLSTLLLRRLSLGLVVNRDDVGWVVNDNLNYVLDMMPGTDITNTQVELHEESLYKPFHSLIKITSPSHISVN